MIDAIKDFLFAALAAVLAGGSVFLALKGWAKLLGVFVG